LDAFVDLKTYTLLVILHSDIHKGLWPVKTEIPCSGKVQLVNPCKRGNLHYNCCTFMRISVRVNFAGLQVKHRSCPTNIEITLHDLPEHVVSR